MRPTSLRITIIPTRIRAGIVMPLERRKNLPKVGLLCNSVQIIHSYSGLSRNLTKPSQNLPVAVLSIQEL